MKKSSKCAFYPEHWYNNVVSCPISIYKLKYEVVDYRGIQLHLKILCVLLINIFNQDVNYKWVTNE